MAMASEIDTDTVLVVDDDPDARQSLEFLIRSVGLNIRSYASAADFLASPDVETAGCLVLDLRMPGMSGLELQDRLNEAKDKLALLTAGERDVLERLRAGKSNKEIAGDLGLTRRGIEARRANIMRKLGADSLADLLRLVMVSDGEA